MRADESGISPTISLLPTTVNHQLMCKKYYFISFFCEIYFHKIVAFYFGFELFHRIPSSRIILKLNF